jgi:hypothetical protein
MARRPTFSLLRWLGTIAWGIALALAPWWVGFPLLLSMAATLLLLQHRLAPGHRWLLRHGLVWGLPGALFALQRALGGGLFAWVIALLGMLAGYTLLAGFEAWLDRDARRAVKADPGDEHPSDAETSDWPRLARAPVGPPAEIIELQAPRWCAAAAGIDDPCGGRVVYRDGAYGFDDGTRIDGVAAQAAFSPSGRWFAAPLANDRGIALRDRDTGRLHRLRGWQLDGWHREQPWLIRRHGDMPLALRAVLGDDAVADD